MDGRMDGRTDAQIFYGYICDDEGTSFIIKPLLAIEKVALRSGAVCLSVIKIHTDSVCILVTDRQTVLQKVQFSQKLNNLELQLLLTTNGKSHIHGFTKNRSL